MHYGTSALCPGSQRCELWLKSSPLTPQHNHNSSWSLSQEIQKWDKCRSQQAGMQHLSPLAASSSGSYPTALQEPCPLLPALQSRAQHTREGQEEIPRRINSCTGHFRAGIRAPDQHRLLLGFSSAGNTGLPWLQAEPNRWRNDSIKFCFNRKNLLHFSREQQSYGGRKASHQQCGEQSDCAALWRITIPYTFITLKNRTERN